MNLKKLIPQRVQNLVPYSSARREAAAGEIWLNANESPYSSLGDQYQRYTRYPDPQPQALIRAYAKYARLPESQILVTRGIDEGIDLLIRAYCEPGSDRVMFMPPTYGMYRIAAQSQGVETTEIALSEDFEPEPASLFTQGLPPKLIFLCSPNNPTGNLLSTASIRSILEASRGDSLVVLDEAYIEFEPQSSQISLLTRYPHLIILRTLSKGFGLAGLRVGFVLAAPELIEVLQKVSAPYPIPVPISDMATEALSDEGQSRLSHHVRQIIDERTRLEASLKHFDFVERVFPSAANFVLIKVRDASRLMNYVNKSGIIIRNQSWQTGLSDTVRISIGAPEEMAKLQQVLLAFEEQV